MLWEEDTPLWSTSSDSLGAGCDAPQPQLMLPVSEEAGDPLTGVSGHCDLDELPVEYFKDDGVECQAEIHK